jgi:hypothetical protein
MKRELIGQVGVDSGQLMIIDPCYIDGEWESKGKVIGVQFWGQGQDEVAELLRECGEAVEELNGTYRIMTDNTTDTELIENKIRMFSEDIQKIVLSSIITTSTYNQTCDITAGEKQGGQLNYRMGHAGLGVVFSSGLGDGIYDVYATYKDLGDWGERITKVEIILVEDDELE